MFLRKVSQDLAEAFQWAAVPSARSSPLSASCWHVPSKEKSKCKSVGGGKKKKVLKTWSEGGFTTDVSLGQNALVSSSLPRTLWRSGGSTSRLPALASSWPSHHGSPPSAHPYLLMALPPWQPTTTLTSAQPWPQGPHSARAESPVWLGRTSAWPLFFIHLLFFKH